MTRKKVQLAYISNDSARKATFKKRKKGLMKKLRELSTLCGINACAMVYSPYGSQPEVWPSTIGVQRVLSEFWMLSEMDQSKNMMNQETFMRQRIVKASDHLKRQMKENREKEMTQVMFHCLVGKMGLQHFTLMDLSDLGWLIDQYLRDIKRGKEMLRRSNNNGHNFENPTVAAGPAAPAAVILQDLTTNLNAENQENVTNQEQWFLDLMNNPPQELMFNNFNNNNNNSLVWSDNFFP